ncbi:hypothetical protein HN681_03515 [archaeon]|nr:hypothetical protein [archaeon]MBT7053127.1 hypothetical protein [archaeon]MBT8010485.1 hypothetical protein [archaeon]
MIIKRGLLIFVVLFLIVPFVFAANGCCGETVSGNTCVYTSEDSCDTPSYFNENAQCEDTSFCGVGCCEKPDGLCSEGAGEYSCDVVDGEWSGGSCDSLDSCEKVCCVYGDSYTYNTESYCENLYDQYGGDIDYYDVNSETECYEMERQSNQGCCVTEDGCGYVSLGECEVDEIDIDTGYGFFENDFCHDVSSDLEEGGYDSAAMCDCELDEDSYTCDTSGLYVLEVDTCGNQGDVVEECNYPSSICSESSGKAECISTSCAETFSFPEDSHFSLYNNYKVYYQGAESEFDFKEIQLGQSRKNGETWCIYESPVGGFSDRVGSRHYEAMCYNGEEIINSCGESKDRDQVCVVTYDENIEEFIGRCEDNNYDEYYTDSLLEENIYYDRFQEPVSDELGEDFGVSTVAPSGSDSCSQGTIDCSLWYGDQTDTNPDKGWELYGNAICLKDDFAFVAADYCASRGDCGIGLNVLGKESGESGLQIYVDRDQVTDGGSGLPDPTYVCHSNDYTFQLDNDKVEESLKWIYSLKDGLVIGEIISSVSFWDLGSHEENDKYFKNFYPTILQAKDRGLFASEIKELYESGSEEAYGCQQYDTNDITESYFEENSNENLQGVIQETFSRNYMINPWMSLQSLIIHSTSFLPSNKEDSSGDICHASDQRFRKLAWGMGFNPSSDKGESASDISQSLRNYEDYSVDTSLDTQYGELDLDLYSNLRSAKPWVMDQNSLLASDLGANGDGSPSKSLTFYVGNIAGCGDTSEFKDAYKSNDILEVKQNFVCSSYEAPVGGEDCSLCDTLISEGGLVYDKDGKIYTGTLCSQARCESLGATCAYIEDNRELAIYDESRPSCIDGGDCNLIEKPVRSVDLDLLDEQNFKYENSENGTKIYDLPVMETFKFALEVDSVANCKFVNEDDLPEDWVTNPDSVEYDTLISTVPLSGYTSYHNFTWHVDEAEYTQRFYVSCKNYCGEANIDFYLVEFETDEGEDIIPPVIQTIYPLDGELINSQSEEVELKIYLNEYADCRYSENAYTDYDLMENDFTYCDNSYGGESSGLGYPVCYTNIDLTNESANLNILCKDTDGNAMTEPKLWGVTKTEPLLVSQTAPSGDLYYNDVTMQIYTTNGGDSGNSICSFKAEGSSYYVDMENSNTNYHEQIFSDLSEGEYSYSISCEDDVGNEVETTVEFNVVVDRSASEISGLYYLGTTLYIITDESATCEYDDESFSYGSGTETAGSASTDHTIAVESGGSYYINCEDEFGNEMDEVVINLGYFIQEGI